MPGLQHAGWNGLLIRGLIGAGHMANLVLVHGINDTNLKFKTMQTVFEQAGHRCFVPSLVPKNASKGLVHLAGQLKCFIDAELAQIEPFSVVGFSMGGLVSRYYLQTWAGQRRVRHFFSIAAPHHGSVLAYCSASQGAQDMRPGSGFLRALAQGDERLQHLPCYSYWTPLDTMILPATSSVWANADNIRVVSLCHPLMVKNRWIMADILAKVGA